MSLFQGLEIGKKALMSHQASMNTASHNVANVNTPGFTRQRVNLTNAEPVRFTYGIMGMGVDIASVERMRDKFISNRWREENQGLGHWSSRSSNLEQVESFFNEPQDTSLGAVINDFWASWQELAKQPEKPENRNMLVQQTNLLTNAFHQLHRQLFEQRKSVNEDIEIKVAEINNLGSEIASINSRINQLELAGESANDLRDQRDLLIDQLSSYVDVTVRENERGNITVYMGSMGFVDSGSFWELDVEKVSDDNIAAANVKWKNTELDLEFFNGEMKSLFDMRDEVLPSYLDKVNNLARTIVQRVNEAHLAGYGMPDSLGNPQSGYNFFDPLGVTADTISLNIEIDNDHSLIAASTSGEVGDGSNALAIADLLKVDKVMVDNTTTIDEFYRQIIGSIGTQVMEAQNQKQNYELLVQQLDNARQSVHGVSLDEEMANLVKYQHAYNAAARIINFIDQSLETLLNTGVAGR